MSIELIFNRQDYIDLLEDYEAGRLPWDFKYLLSWYLSQARKDISMEEYFKLIDLLNDNIDVSSVLEILK